MAVPGLAGTPVRSAVLIQRGGRPVRRRMEAFREMLDFIEMAGSAVVAMLYVAILAAVVTRKPQKRSEPVPTPLRAVEESYER